MAGRLDQLAAARVALGRVLRKRLLKDGSEIRIGDRGGRLFLQVGPEHRQLRVAHERGLSGQALVEQATERVEVGPAVDLLARDLLWRSVGGGAEREPVRGGDALLGEAPAEAEVGQVGVLLRIEQHVRGLHVSVDERFRVGGVERARDLGADSQGPARV